MPTDDVEFQLEARDVRRFARFMIRRRTAALRRTWLFRALLGVLISLVVLLLTLAGVLGALSGGFGWVPTLLGDPSIRLLLGLLAVSGFVAVGLRFAVPSIVASQAMKSRHLEGSQHLTLGDDGIEARGPHAKASYAWTGIEDLVREDGDLYVLLSSQQGFVVPGRAFADEAELEAFEARCRAALADAETR